MRIITLFLLVGFITNSNAQKENLTDVWPAKWIMSDGPAKDYSVHHFRKTFRLSELPDTLIIHTSGDNRYQLFVNEQMVTLGPLRGDLRHWYYETTDIAPFLKQGKNVIAAIVLNYGSHPPDAQLTVQTGFILAADDKSNRYLNTPNDWKARYNPAYSPNIIGKEQVNGYYGGGSKEIVDGNKFIWDWQKIDFDDEDWKNAIEIENAFAKSCKWASRWKLTPRILPHETLTPERFERVRIAENVKIPESFPNQPTSFTIPADTKCRFVLDRAHQTTAYPMLNVSKGKNATIKLTYVEAPYLGEASTKGKGDRNVVEGKNFIGFYDQFIADGGMNREFKPLWWRAYRYIEVQIETFEEPLTINDISGVYSTFPFEQKASFAINDKEGKISNDKIQKIIEIGDRTMKACSHEHFMDCPYYEESQFQGDARVEMLVSYYNYGNPSLAKQGIELFSWSVNDEGFLSARYPTNSYYYIPNFSIYWIAMLYDYMMLYDDHDYIQTKMHIARYLMNYFERNERADGTLKKLDYHQFVDWSHPAGEPALDSLGNSSIVDMHYLLALQWMIALEKQLSTDTFYLNKYLTKEKALKTVIHQKYWDAKERLYSDIPGSNKKLSQHANCLAILTDVAPLEEKKAIMKKVLTYKRLTPATLYWSFYVFEALQNAGLGDEYLNHLGVWEEVMALNVSTWPETGADSRSECHAWGSSPNYHFLKIIAGINSASPGFNDVLIQPHMGELEKLEASFPHYKGTIEVKLDKSTKEKKAIIILPKGVKGKFIWEGKDVELFEGVNKIE